MRAGLLCALLVSCAASSPGPAGPGRGDVLARETVQALETQYEKSNVQSRAEALRGYLTTHRLDGVVAQGREVGYVPEEGGGVEQLPATRLEVVARAPARGLHGHEWLLREQEEATGAQHLVFASAACAHRDTCGCWSPSYVVTSPRDGKVKVLRLWPRIREHHVTQRGTCTVGCGATPPNEPRGFALPSNDASKVEIVDVPYAADLLDVACEVSEPAP